MTAIVVTVSEYEGTPEEAERDVREATSHYESPTFVYAADSLDNLPHPSQVTEISSALGV